MRYDSASFPPYGGIFGGFCTRNVIELRRLLGSIPIEEIKLNAKSRDDTPTLLIGLQAIYTLLAVKCCLENNRWADFLDWRACRAAAA